jgi:hypothetical protein
MDRQWLIDYFVARDYTLAGKYLWMDQENFWFMLRTSPR